MCLQTAVLWDHPAASVVVLVAGEQADDACRVVIIVVALIEDLAIAFAAVRLAELSRFGDAQG